jgi:hypothetical protein
MIKTVLTFALSFEEIRAGLLGLLGVILFEMSGRW